MFYVLPGVRAGHPHPRGRDRVHVWWGWERRYKIVVGDLQELNQEMQSIAEGSSARADRLCSPDLSEARVQGLELRVDDTLVEGAPTRVRIDHSHPF